MVRNLYRLLVLSLTLLAAQFIFAGPNYLPMATAQAATQNKQTLVSQIPLETRLNPDGTLKFESDFSGSLNPQGWQIELGRDGQPRFAPVESAVDHKSWSSEIGTADSGGGIWIGFDGFEGETNPIINAI